MLSTLSRFFTQKINASTSVSILTDLIIFPSIYYLVFDYFCRKYSCSNILLYELGILWISIIASIFTMHKTRKSQIYNDSLTALIVMLVFTSVAFLYYTPCITMYYTYFTTVTIAFFFVIKPCILFIFNIKKHIAAMYENCNISVVLEDNFSKIQQDILQVLNNQYTIKSILNFSSFDTSALHIKTVTSIEAFEKLFTKISKIFSKDSAKKVVYIAGAPNQDRIKELLKLSVKYNFQLFRTNYLENLTNMDIRKKINLIPFSSKDFDTQLVVNSTNKHFMINFFRNKNVWISYQGEDLIFEFIRQIAKSGVGRLNIFTSSEQYASQINLLLKNFNALHFTIHFARMSDTILMQQSDTPDYIFYVTEINDPSFGLDNFFSAIDRNFFEIKKLKSLAEKMHVQEFFLISDITNLECTNWINVTQKLGEFYVKSTPSGIKSHVIRIPRSKVSIATLDDFLISSLNANGKVIIPESFKSNFLTNTLFNTFIRALKESLEYHKTIMHISQKNPENSLIELMEILLNIKGIKLNDNVSYVNDLKNDLKEFPPLQNKTTVLEDGLFILADFLPKTETEIDHLESELTGLIKGNAIPDVINKCVSFTRETAKK